MKIIINLLNFTSENITGTGYFMKRIFELLNAQNTKEISFYIFHSSNIDVRKIFSINEQLDVTYKSVKYMTNIGLRILYEQLVLPFYLSGYEVFYSPTPAVPVLFRFNNTKIIATIHDLIPFYIKDKYSFIRRLYVRWITKKSAKNSDSIITVSNNSCCDIVKVLGIKEKKISIVYNFLSNRNFVKSKISKNYFITICTIEPGKNLSNLLKAFKIFKDRYDKLDFKLYIVGKKGWDYEQVFYLHTVLELQDHVIFTGYISEEEKNVLIQESMAMLYLSAYEGFGIPPLEAMYWNKPSIVSNTSSLPEVVGKAGIQCDPYNLEEIAESMARIIMEKDELCDKIPCQLRKFEPTEQVNKFLQIIKM